MNRDGIDFGTAPVPVLFRKLFIPTLLGMLSISAVATVDGIFVGHGVGSDGIAAVNICIPLLMFFTGIGLMAGAGCSVVSSIHLADGNVKAARINVTQALLFVTAVTLVPVVLIMCMPELLPHLRQAWSRAGLWLWSIYPSVPAACLSAGSRQAARASC